MQPDVRYDWCSNSEVGALMRFMHEHWRNGHVLSRDEELLRWQFSASRSGSRNDLSVLLAWSEGNIVGLLGVIPFNLNARGQTLPSVWLSHWMALPSVRNQGVALELMRRVLDGTNAAVWVLGINDRVRTIYQRLGFEILPDMPRWVSVIDADASRSLLWAAHPAADESTIDELVRRHSVENAIPTASNIDIVFCEAPFGASWDAIWNRHWATKLVCGSRDAAYLNWRYLQHPRYSYRVMLATGGGASEPLGLAIVRAERVRERNEVVLRVLEFLATPEAETALVNAVVSEGRQVGAAFADFYGASGGPLERSGFAREQRVGNVGVPCRLQPLEGNAFALAGAFWLRPDVRSALAPVLNHSDLYITKSDGDMDRPN